MLHNADLRCGDVDNQVSHRRIRIERLCVKNGIGPKREQPRGFAHFTVNRERLSIRREAGDAVPLRRAYFDLRLAGFAGSFYFPLNRGFRRSRNAATPSL